MGFFTKKTETTRRLALKFPSIWERLQHGRQMPHVGRVHIKHPREMWR